MIKIRFNVSPYYQKYKDKFCIKYVEPECLTEGKPFRFAERMFYIVSFSPIKDLECLWDYECEIISQEERRQKILDQLC